MALAKSATPRPKRDSPGFGPAINRRTGEGNYPSVLPFSRSPANGHQELTDGACGAVPGFCQGAFQEPWGQAWRPESSTFSGQSAAAAALFGRPRCAGPPRVPGPRIGPVTLRADDVYGNASQAALAAPSFFAPAHVARHPGRAFRQAREFIRGLTKRSPCGTTDARDAPPNGQTPAEVVAERLCLVSRRIHPPAVTCTSCGRAAR